MHNIVSEFRQNDNALSKRIIGITKYNFIIMIISTKQNASYKS